MSSFRTWRQAQLRVWACLMTSLKPSFPGLSFVIFPAMAPTAPTEIERPTTCSFRVRQGSCPLPEPPRAQVRRAVPLPILQPVCMPLAPFNQPCFYEQKQGKAVELMSACSSRWLNGWAIRFITAITTRHLQNVQAHRMPPFFLMAPLGQETVAASCWAFRTTGSGLLFVKRFYKTARLQTMRAFKPMLCVVQTEQSLPA